MNGGTRPDGIGKLIGIGKLREQNVQREQVAAIWRKAIESAQDAVLPGMSIDGSLRSAYDAGHLAAIALLAAHGLRTTGTQGHHEAAFAGAAALEFKGLENLVPDSMQVRGLRKGSMYDPVIAGPGDAKEALDWMQRTLPAIRQALLQVDPKLADLLLESPGAQV